jgi:CheY-like chemotaxis protein
MNLCTSAYHAILARGEADLQLIEIVLQQVELSEAEVYGLGDHLKPGRYVRLTITDSGCGMEPEIMKRVFDPYFSTKKVGEGTGLGLATVHSIVIGCGGAIKLKSEPGVGTTFEVFFPQGSPSPALPGKVFDELPAGSGNERVMVVDDEVPVMELECRILEKAGYRVTSFSDSFEALAWFRQNPAALDLIISDLNMPRILGTDLARSILEARPDLPIVLVSGYTDKDNIQKMKDIGIREFLYKPVERDTLLKAARRNLPKVSVGRNESN